MRRKTSCRSSLLAGICCLAAAAAAPAARAQSEPAIAWKRNLPAAFSEADAERKVVVVAFSAPWCQWCRKMAVSTFPDRKVVALADRFVWVKVDVQRRGEIAAAFGVTGVPQIFLLSARGGMLASRSGYLSADALAELLRENMNKGDDPGVAAEIVGAVDRMRQALRSAATDAEHREALIDVVELLAKPDRLARAYLLQRIVEQKETAKRGLIACLSDERLAVRAAAAQALASATGQEVAFDPFAEPQRRAEQIATLRKALSLPETGGQDDAAEPDSPDPHEDVQL